MIEEGDRRLSLNPAHRLLVRAVRGERAAIVEGLANVESVDSRLAAALVLRARQAGIDLPEETSEKRSETVRLSAVRSLQFRAALDSVGCCLDEIGVRWLPIKGNDLAFRVYEEPEDRPAADLDVLVAPVDFQRAQRALEDGGWRSLWGDPITDRFVIEEGYCWTALSAEQVLLELHFRLWGMIPEGLAAEIVEQASPDPRWPGEALSATLPHAFLLSVCHLFQRSPPRGFLDWWDLERIVAHSEPDFVASVVEIARRWDQQLPMALAALYAGALWQNQELSEIGALMASELRPTERWLLRGALRSGVGEVPLSRVVLARLLAGRRRRTGWLGLRRRIWAHPGVVSRATSASWPWPLRRLFYLVASMSTKRAAALRLFFDRRYPEAGSETSA